MDSINRLKQRHNIRLFDDTVIPSRKEIFDIFSLLDYIPNQRFDKFLDHINLVLEPEHYDFKYWLCTNIFYNVVKQEDIDAKITNDKVTTKQYMVQVISAPYVILTLDIGTSNNDPLPRQQDRTCTNIGIEIGFLIDKYLSLGLDLANVGCTVGWDFNTKEKQAKLNSYLSNLFLMSDILTEYNSNNINVQHALCVGKGLPNLENVSNCTRYYKELPYYACNKSKKSSNLVYKK
tara:strand:+ start:93 stop:794 length:702 start_codon:yes stop_codon:yes gene_type:complete